MIQALKTSNACFISKFLVLRRAQRPPFFLGICFILMMLLMTSCKRKSVEDARLEERKEFSLRVISMADDLAGKISQEENFLDRLRRSNNICNLTQYSDHPVCSGVYSLGVARVILTDEKEYFLIVPSPFEAESIQKIEEIEDGATKEEMLDITGGCCYVASAGRRDHGFLAEKTEQNE